jgi:hypothetical protein
MTAPTKTGDPYPIGDGVDHCPFRHARRRARSLADRQPVLQPALFADASIASTRNGPCFALVVQGAKSLTLGSEVYRYGVGDYLVVSLDLPVVSRVTQASAEAPNFGLGMKIEPDRLKDLLSRVNIARRHCPGQRTRSGRQQGAAGSSGRRAAAAAPARPAGGHPGAWRR